jgi:pyridoxal phosphate enzyme (YggS family)
MKITAEKLKLNIQTMTEKINVSALKSGRNATDITCVAVSKNVDIDTLKLAAENGLRNFGENYVQEFLPKYHEFQMLKYKDLRWHFIGHIQSNKMKSIIGICHRIHSVDRISLVDEMESRTHLPQNVIVEVNLAGETTKSGVKTEELAKLIEHIQSTKKIILNGFMFMPPINFTQDQSKKYYAEAVQLRDQYAKQVSGPHSLSQLSMGTSHDYELAIESGATIVRLGTTIFGERK